MIGSRIITTAVNAALANGMLAHADETDDSHAPSLTHPGCGIVPAALAMAERERRNGAALAPRGGAWLRRRLPADAVPRRLSVPQGWAFDPQLRADVRSRGRRGRAGGPAGAPGAPSALVTAQQASGISCWMRDAEHVEKAFDFGGMPARNGVAAATMVAHGFTGVDDVFAGERNFFVAYGRKPDPEVLIARPRRRSTKS